MELIIDKEFQSLIPPLQDREYWQLEENIARDGCTNPLDVRNGAIIDGHNRYKICKDHNLSFEVNEHSFVDREEAKIWIIRNQFGRRNLNAFQRAELVLVLEPLVAAKAKERQIAAQNNNAGKAVRENSHEQVEAGRTDETLAKLSGISSNSIRRAKLIKEKGTPEQIEKARSGLKSINAIYTEIKHQGITEKTCAMCGKMLPIDRFYGEGATCKTCTELRKQTLLSGGTVSCKVDVKKSVPLVAKPEYADVQTPETHPAPAKTGGKKDGGILGKIIQDLYDQDRVVVHTVDDILEDIGTIADTYLRQTKRSFEIFSDVLLSADDLEKIKSLMRDTVRRTNEIMESITP